MRNLFLLLFIPLLSISQTSEKSLNKSNWEFRKYGNKEWLPATVPGTVHTDLFSNNKIPDPFYGDNEKQLQWIENEDWEYKTIFDVSKQEFNSQHIEIQFDGLDTYTNVYLNDSLILSADNMFRSWNVDVKNFVHKRENNLKIIFHSAVKIGKEEAKKLPYTLPGDEKVFTRKAQYQYGWDFGPRFVTCGIYKDVKLIFWNKAKIENVHYNLKSITKEVAELEFKCEIKSDVDSEFTLNAVRFLSQEASEMAIASSQQTIHLKKGMNVFSINHSIKNPQLWWSNGLGNAYLYSFGIQLTDEEKQIDDMPLKVGLRTLELMQETDSIGKSFYFKLNGVPVFMKGANYIPPNEFLPRVKKTDYEKIVKNAVDANMNMLRVWGGGVYADDEFYKACDKNGILVWQDFMFACAMYPGDEHFINNVSEEMKQQIIRLRNHPSIALWCGNNEIDEGWKNWGWQKQYQYSKTDSTKIWNDYTNLFQKKIPNIVSKYDSQHAYWQSSPSIGWGHKESLLQGDAHYWGVWWGLESFDIYKQKVGRFMSEYGFQGMPNISTFYRMGIYKEKKQTRERCSTDDYIDYSNNLLAFLNSKSDKYVFDSVVFNAHQKHPTGYQTITTYMERDYIVPKDFENYIYVSQLLQAEGMKTAIEAHRRAKPYCMGTLFWQLNDCWPGVSWSSVDYYGDWKASHYVAKRSYENCIVSINEEDNQLKVYIVNDELKQGNGVLEMKVIDFSGNILWIKNKNITINSNSSAVYFSIDESEFSKYDIKQIVFNASIKISNEKTASSNYYFVKPKDLLLQKPEIEVVLSKSEDAFEITTNTLVKDLFLTANEPGVVLSDNYFDLLPNETKTIYFESDHSLSSNLPYSNLPSSTISLFAKSLYDTFH